MSVSAIILTTLLEEAEQDCLEETAGGQKEDCSPRAEEENVEAKISDPAQQPCRSGSSREIAELETEVPEPVSPIPKSKKKKGKRGRKGTPKPIWDSACEDAPPPAPPADSSPGIICVTQGKDLPWPLSNNWRLRPDADLPEAPPEPAEEAPLVEEPSPVDEAQPIEDPSPAEEETFDGNESPAIDSDDDIVFQDGDVNLTRDEDVTVETLVEAPQAGQNTHDSDGFYHAQSDHEAFLMPSAPDPKTAFGLLPSETELQVPPPSPPPASATATSVLEATAPSAPTEDSHTVTLKILTDRGETLRCIVFITACTRTAILNEARGYCEKDKRLEKLVSVGGDESSEIKLCSLKMYGYDMDLSSYKVENLSSLVRTAEKTGIPRFTLRLSGN